MPLTPHVTLVLAKPETVAVKVALVPAVTFADGGEMVTLAGVLTTVTEAEALCVPATTWIVIGFAGATAGAV